jgi:hypothetical protein
VLLIGGLDADGLLGVLPPLVLAALATCSWATLSLKQPTCDNDTFLHASASR